MPVPAEAEVVRRLYHDRALGRPFNDIALEWNAAGLRPRSVRGVREFSRQTIAAIVQNRFYMGEVSHLGETRKGQHAPIVTEEEWSSAHGTKARTNARRRLPPLLLQGLAACARCNRSLYPSRPHKGPKHPGERYSYYREPSRDKNRACPDAGLLWNSAEADGVVDNLVRMLTMSPDWLASVAAGAARPSDTAERRRAEVEDRRRRI